MKLSRKKQVGLGVCLVVLVAAGIGVKVVWAQLNQPATAALTTGPERRVENDYAIDLSPATQTGSYASFDYPKSMTSSPRDVAPPYLESFYYHVKDVQTWSLAVSISTLPADDLSASSDYMLRKNHPEQYTASEQTIHGTPVVIMTDTAAGGFSKVAFLRHNGKLAAISLSGNHLSTTEPLEKAFTMVLESWEWLR